MPRRTDRVIVSGPLGFPCAVLLQLHQLRQHRPLRGRMLDEFHGRHHATLARLQLRGLRELVPVRQHLGAQQLRRHDLPIRHRVAGREQQLCPVQYVDVREQGQCDLRQCEVDLEWAPRHDGLRG